MSAKKVSSTENGLRSQSSAKFDREKMVLEHMSLVRAIAVRVHENLPVNVDLDDLLSAGYVGMLEALGKYQVEKRVVFASYSKHRIKGAILDFLRGIDPATRDSRRKAKTLDKATAELTGKLGHTPTTEELAGFLGFDVQLLHKIRFELAALSNPLSISQRMSGDDDLPAPDSPAPDDVRPDHVASKSHLRELLLIAAKTLPERYQIVIRLYYASEMTMKQIGMVLGINESRVSQIHKNALEKLRALLVEQGVTCVDSLL